MFRSFSLAKSLVVRSDRKSSFNRSGVPYSLQKYFRNCKNNYLEYLLAHSFCVQMSIQIMRKKLPVNVSWIFLSHNCLKITLLNCLFVSQFVYIYIFLYICSFFSLGIRKLYCRARTSLQQKC